MKPIAASLWAAAASAFLAAPAGAAITPAKLVASPYTAWDYPQLASHNSQMGYTRIRVTVSPQGKPFECLVIASSGTASLDAASCDIMLKRGQFTPARDDKGKSSYALYEQTVPWFIAFNAKDMQALEASYPKPNDADIEVNVARLPAGLASPLAVIADVMVSRDGKLLQCAADAGGSVPAALAKAACAQVAALVNFKTALVDGRAVPSVQQVKVVFFSEPQAAAK
ncbi:TonB family protein [Polymorphobacter arshaanensis]|nr:TonB family protein [Polymorphobacter arshaanensis]